MSDNPGAIQGAQNRIVSACKLHVDRAGGTVDRYKQSLRGLCPAVLLR